MAFFPDDIRREMYQQMASQNSLNPYANSLGMGLTTTRDPYNDTFRITARAAVEAGIKLQEPPQPEPNKVLLLLEE